MDEKQKRTIKQSAVYWGLPVLSISLVIVAWILFSANNPQLMPSPAAVLDRFIKTLERPIAKTPLYGHAIASLLRVLTALIAAWLIGTSLGILIGWNRGCKAVIGTLFEIIRPIPPIAWIPIIIMWFGIDEFPKILIVFIGAVVSLVINTASGIRLVDKANIDAGKILGGSTLQILRKIVIPTALPSIFAGISTSVGSGWATVLAAEMIAAQKGLGALVTKGWQGNDMALVIVSVITIALIGALLALLLNLLERVVCPWKNN